MDRFDSTELHWTLYSGCNCDASRGSRMEVARRSYCSRAAVVTSPQCSRGGVETPLSALPHVYH